jgi:U5 small nuclear ribonucleoprotein component
MEENLYDEFGNYIGPEIEDEETEQVEPEMQQSASGSPQRENRFDENQQALIQHEEMGNRFEFFF